MFQRTRKDLWLEVLCFIALLASGVTSDGFYLKKFPINKEVEEGSRMFYECLAIPSNQIIYRWSQNDRPITLNYHRYIATDNRTLIFDHLDRDIDPGSYNCLAQNSSSKFARKSRSGKLEVNWLDPEVEIKMMQPSSVADLTLGRPVLLKCEANAYPKITKDTINWYFNGNTELPSGIIIQKDGGLLIESLEPSHNGFYHCQIFHTAGKLDTVAPFIMALNGQSLNPSGFTKYAKEGAKVVLKCPWVNARIIWSKIHRLGDPLTLVSPDSSANILIKDDTLTISPMDLYSDAYYLCQNIDKGKTKTALFRVSLAKMYNFKRNQFSPSLDENERLIIRQGENGGIRFYIDLTPSNSFIFDKIPNPPPTISWSYGGTEIPKWNGDPNIIPGRKHVFRSRHLIIQNASLSDQGMYTIKMENEGGKQTKQFKVSVTFPPTFEESSQESTIHVNEDESLSLNCKIKKISSEGTTKIYWKKDGTQIAMYMQSLTYENDGKNLHIDKAKSEHTGTYQCFVKTLGFPEFYNKPQNLVVKAKLQFTGINYDVFLEVNKNGSIHCKTKGFGKIQIKWFDLSNKESDSIKPNRLPITYPHMILKNGTLVLKNVQKEYSGDYLCEARSYLTNEVINRTVKVKVGEKPKITFISVNKTLKEGSALFLDCIAVGDPNPTISWFMDNSLSQKQLITFDINQPHNDRKKLLKNGTLIIRNVGLSDEAKYTCFATNNQFIAAEEAVIVKVLTIEEFNKLKQNNNFNKGMVKTIIIVVSCALAYLALIIGLTAFCSLRMLRHRRNRSLTASNVEKLGDNTQLMKPLGGSNPNGGCNSNDRMTSKSSRSVPNKSATNNFLPQVPFTSSHGYYTQYNPSTMPNYLNNPLLDAQGSEFQHLMSAPPPTPLESRSNFSTNSASIYTKSQFSSSTNGGITGVGGVNSMERLTYPRHELQTEGILGKGDFGDVFLARARNILDGESQSLVIVKSLSRNEPIHCHEFHRQLDLLARTESDFVTKLLGICIEMEPCLLILEYCEWGDLKQFLQCIQSRSNPKILSISRQQKLSICGQIARGMEHISSIRCVHKDLATRNILVNPQLNVKISHLGLCRDIHQGDYYQDGDQIIPLRWMPPESVLKNEFSLQTDVWSYAVTCWEIFALGALPISTYKNQEIVDTLASCSPLSQSKIQTMYGTLEQFPNECPQTFVSVIKRCLHLDPQNRPNFVDICKTMIDIEAGK